MSILQNWMVFLSFNLLTVLCVVLLFSLLISFHLVIILMYEVFVGFDLGKGFCELLKGLQL